MSQKAYASCNARLDGRFEAWTVKGKPYNVLNADKWIELSSDPIIRANQWLNAINGHSFRETTRIVLCNNPLEAFQRDVHLITCRGD